MLQVCNYNINLLSYAGIVLLSIAESESLSENQIHLF